VRNGAAGSAVAVWVIDMDKRERPTARQAGDVGKKNFKIREIREKRGGEWQIWERR
jgi:hypothetical protein